MTTENKNENRPNSIFDIYKDLGVSNVSENLIVIDHSQYRIENVKLYVSLLVGLPFVMTILSYNTQDLTAFIGTILFTVLIFIYSKYKYFIWHKKISFDNVKGTITYERNFPPKNHLFKYDTMRISSKMHYIKNHGTLHYHLYEKGLDAKKEKAHSMFPGYIYAESKDTELFIKLLKQFMKQGDLAKGLKLYHKDSI